MDFYSDRIYAFFHQDRLATLKDLWVKGSTVPLTLVRLGSPGVAAGHGNITVGLGLPPEAAVRGVYWSLQGVVCPRHGSVIVLPLAAVVSYFPSLLLLLLSFSSTACTLLTLLHPSQSKADEYYLHYYLK